MWIRTQYNILVNLDNVEGVYADGREIKSVGLKTAIILLGTYATETRALEVLDEIQERLMGKVTVYEDGHIEPFSIGDVYVMPKE